MNMYFIHLNLFIFLMKIKYIINKDNLIILVDEYIFFY